MQEIILSELEDSE